jgi:hypothetical protein
MPIEEESSPIGIDNLTKFLEQEIVKNDISSNHEIRIEEDFDTQNPSSDQNFINIEESDLKIKLVQEELDQKLEGSNNGKQDFCIRN